LTAAVTNEDSAANAFETSTKDLDLQLCKPKPAIQTTFANLFKRQG
jgi:hypothetical protein